MIFGIVVEGDYDSSVYSAFIQRIRPDVDRVLARPCDGVAGLRKRFVGWLKDFQWQSGYQVGKALVIRDSDRGESGALEDELARILKDKGFRATFPVHFYATRCVVETWLLADEEAVNKVAHDRDKPGSAKRIADPLEVKQNAKDLFRAMLSQVQLPADPMVYGEVARAARIELIRQRCPYFQRFVDYVHAC